MKDSGHRNPHSKILTHLFFRLLPVQVLIVAMGSVNSIVDGVVAARGIDAGTVGVIGLYYSMVRVFEAVSAVLLGGSAVLCGRYLGRGDTQKIKGMFSLNLTVAFLTGVVLTFVNTVLAPSASVVLGADTALQKSALAVYARGYAIGIIPMLLAGQLAAFLQMEHSYTRNYVGVAVMIALNIILDILFVYVLHLELWGLALATSISNWAYFLVLVPHFLRKKTVFAYQFSGILWERFKDMIVIGFPGAILVICLAARYMVINRLLIRYGATGVWIALVLGIAATATLGFIYSILCNRRIPRTLSEWLLIDQTFGSDTNPRLCETVRSTAEVSSVAEKVQGFCTQHDVPHREAFYVALCLEEMAGNIADHGFQVGKGSHAADIRVILKEDRKICTVIRDDCIPFDPLEWAQITSGGDPADNIGIRMVLRLASDVSYQNLLGMNVLSMEIDS